MPVEIEARAELFRSITAGRRIILILDNAFDEAQVRPLLPATSTCAVIVTSRARLSALGADLHYELSPFTDAEAMSFLATNVGARVAAEQDATVMLLSICGNLPLALRVAAARLAARPGWPIARLVGALADEQDRMRELRIGDLAVESSIELSYLGLRGMERPAFHLLAYIDVPDFGPPLVGSVVEIDQVAAEGIMERLSDAALVNAIVDVRADHPRYAYHDVVRAYARMQCRANETSSNLSRAVGRALNHYSAFLLKNSGPVWNVIPRLRPSQPRVVSLKANSLISMLDAERSSIAKLIIQGTTFDEQLPRVVDVFCLFLGYLLAHNDLVEMAGLLRVIMPAVEDRGDRRLLAACQLARATLHSEYRQIQEARQLVHMALTNAEASGDEYLMLQARHATAYFLDAAGKRDMAMRTYDEVIAAANGLGDRCLEGVGYSDTGITLLRQRTLLEEAERRLVAAHVIFQETGMSWWDSNALICLAELRLLRGDHASAESYLRPGLQLAQLAHDPILVARAHLHYGLLNERREQRAAAIKHYERSLLYANDIGVPMARAALRARALKALSDAYLAIGEYKRAALLADDPAVAREADH